MPKKRTKDLHVFFTESEMDFLQEKMTKAGFRNKSAFVRKMVFEGICVRLNLPELREMTTLLRRCGNNLNQYAKVANATGDIFLEDVKELQRSFQEIRDKADELLDALMQIQRIKV